MTLSMLERRRIEANILKQVYDELVARHGEEEARRVVAGVVRRAAVAQGREFREKEPGGTDLRTFADLLPLWTMEDALEIEVEERTDTRFAFKVKRCRYAEMYHAMGLGHIGHLLSCNRDGTFCEGYDPRIKLKRTQTIMQGAPCCDFDYSFAPEDGSNQPAAEATPASDKAPA